MQKELKRQRLAQSSLPPLNTSNSMTRTKSATPTTPSFGMGTPGGSASRGTKRPRESTSSPHQRQVPPSSRTPIPSAQKHSNSNTHSKPGTPAHKPGTPAMRPSVSTPNRPLPTPVPESHSFHNPNGAHSAAKPSIPSNRPRPIKKQRVVGFLICFLCYQDIHGRVTSYRIHQVPCNSQLQPRPQRDLPAIHPPRRTVILVSSLEQLSSFLDLLFDSITFLPIHHCKLISILHLFNHTNCQK